jgi:cytochrome c-type biogenesis protein CcmH/NrfG
VNRVLGIQLLIAFLCLALVVYFVMLVHTAVALLRSGTPAAVAIGIGVLILPLVGAWVLLATLRAGLAHQRLARLAAEDGAELDVSTLPRRPSGRISREAADALFASVRGELESDPDDWRRWYRLARAYDYAGDRPRAREAMRTAVSLQAREAKR